MLLIIDNYDSFTYNLVDYFRQLGVNVMVFRNDKISIHDAKNLNPSYIVISPGPSDPDHAGISLEIINEFQHKIPILGVCLGHQAVAQAKHAKIIRAPSPEHGTIEKIYHNGSALYKDMPNPFKVTRYHSLMVDKNTMPKDLLINGWNSDDLIMSFSSMDNMLHGVQYHPESIGTENGIRILKNFLEISK